jgi:hypothetical protein
LPDGREKSFQTPPVVRRNFLRLRHSSLSPARSNFHATIRKTLLGTRHTGLWHPRQISQAQSSSTKIEAMKALRSTERLELARTPKQPSNSVQ